MYRKLKLFVKNKSVLFLLIGFIITILSFIIAVNNVRWRLNYNLEKNLFFKNFYKVSITNNKNDNISTLIDMVTKSKINGLYTIPIDEGIKNEREVNVKIAKLIGVYDADPKIFNKNNIKGRYFSDEEIENERYVTIIGELLYDQVYRKNEKEYIQLDQSNTEYEVIGILKGNEYLNNFMFIPIKSLPQELMSSKENNYFPMLVSTVNDFNSLKKLSYNKIHQISEHNTQSFLEIIVDSINYEKETLKNFILDAALGVVSILIFTNFWVNSLKKKFAIFRMVGANNIDICKYIYTSLLLISVIAIPCAISILIILGAIVSRAKCTIDMWVFFTSVILCFIISTIATVSSLNQIFKYKIYSLLK